MGRGFWFRGLGASVTTQTDFYELLEVERSADDAAIKSSYRRLAMQCHPDKNPGCADSEAKFKAISAAYDCLKDPQKRAAYDQFGHAAFEQGGMGGSDGGMGGFSDLGDIFESFFGGAFGGWTGAASRRGAAPTFAMTSKSASTRRSTASRPKSRSKSRRSAIPATARAPSRAPARAAATCAAATARSARSRASSWSSAPARPATAAAK